MSEHSGPRAGTEGRTRDVLVAAEGRHHNRRVRQGDLIIGIRRKKALEERNCAVEDN